MAMTFDFLFHVLPLSCSPAAGAGNCLICLIMTKIDCQQSNLVTDLLNIIKILPSLCMYQKVVALSLQSITRIEQST